MSRMAHWALGISLLALSTVVHPLGAMAAEGAAEVFWQDDYRLATDQAEREGKMLLIYFCSQKEGTSCYRFKEEMLDTPMVREKLWGYVCVRLPIDAEITVEGKPLRLLKHPAFREMLGSSGITILDYAHREAKYYGHVVSTFPVTGKRSYTAKQIAIILDLPPGTLTQRTLIYAVRIHPERPASANGKIDPKLLREASLHSKHQATITLQGHHNWSARFPRINRLLPGRLTACEVCAESWPGENLVEAAIECVRCWRFSEGHWSAVRQYHRVYGYDMKRGRNGVWYATGIFGRK